MTLDDIQTSIYQGAKGIETAFEILTVYLQKHPVKQLTVTPLLKDALAKKTMLRTQFLNQIEVTTKYKNYVKQVLPQSTITDPQALAIQLLEVATADCNKRILDAKEPSTKKNREYEKSEVIRFFHYNFNSFVVLFQLYNVLEDIKTEINR